MLDINIVGGGDHQMAYGLIGKIADSLPQDATPQYEQVVKQWGTNAAALKHNIGAVPGTLAHHFHGAKINRGYYNRWRILSDNEFNPITDLRNDSQGMLMLSGNKPQLRDDLRNYFRVRNEDAT
jgi:hypothetical protein